MNSYKNALIRRVFEAERDVAWTQFIESQAKALGVQPNELDRLRLAFNQYVEDRDWACWQRRAQRTHSVAELADMLDDEVGRSEALGMRSIGDTTTGSESATPNARP